MFRLICGQLLLRLRELFGQLLALRVRGRPWQTLNLLVQVIDLRGVLVDGRLLGIDLLFQVVALGDQAIGSVELILFKLRLNGHQLPIGGLRDLLTIDAGNR